MLIDMSTAAATVMSGNAVSQTPTDRKQLDDAIQVLKSHAQEFARLPPAAKAALVRECMPRIVDVAPVWVVTGCKAKGIGPSLAGEEWTAGVIPTLRMMRLLADSLEAIARDGKPPLGRAVRTRPDGRLEVYLFPASTIDKISFAGFTGHVLMEAGLDREGARRKQASFYDRKEPAGGVALVLGAGNVASIPPMDAFTKMFIEGYVCLIKMNPVNEWVGPLLERALAPMIRRGFLRIVYGGGDVGKYLCEHPDIADIHITGSDKTHDLIVWGPPGAERDRRKRDKDPILKRPISSELGNVSPVAIVPAVYSDDELWFQARNVVSMVANNASFNCNAAKMLITSRGWPQREKFLDLVAKGLGMVPPRTAYYPGAKDRWTQLTSGRQVQTFGVCDTDAKLPWALIRDVADKPGEKLFDTEPFCGLLSETALSSSAPAEFLAEATRFMNDRLWGTLNACIVIHPKSERDPEVARALDRAIVDLRYGTVGINVWPAVCYAVVSLPWGGHPSATLENIQSGLGWVHNTYMLEGIDKSVIRAPFVIKPKPVWYFDNTKGGAIGPRLMQMEASPSWLKLPGLVLSAL
jgi:acyl-CoA reductase-like NAD-dependent aldehyde dehydrogenase